MGGHGACRNRAAVQMGEAANKGAAINEAVKEVAAQARQHAAVCRKCYIPPGIVEAYEDGMLAETARRPIATMRGLRTDEVLTLTVLKRSAAAAKRTSATGRKTTRRATSRAA